MPLPTKSDVSSEKECIRKVVQREMDAGKSEKEALAIAYDHCEDLFHSDSYSGSITRSGWFAYPDGTVFKEFDNLKEVGNKVDIIPAYDYHEGEKEFIGYAHNIRINSDKETLDADVEFWEEPQGGEYDVSIGFPDEWKKRADGTIIQELKNIDHLAVNINGDWKGRCGPTCRIYKNDAKAKSSDSDEAASEQIITNKGKKLMPEKKENLDSEYIKMPKKEFEAFKEEFEAIRNHYDSLVQEKVCNIKESLVTEHNVSKDSLDDLSVNELEVVNKVLATIPKRKDSKTEDGEITDKDAQMHIDSIESKIANYQERIAEMRGAK